MSVLSGLEPKNVFHFFEEICNIPHGSGNVGRISDYLAAFARERGLWCEQDGMKNIIIVKEASEGYEDQPPVMLQGHMDMVAVKEPGCDIDMRTEGLRLRTKGDEVFAEGTSLGGDDGIAVAYALAILDSGDIRHPRLEVVITVDEEVGMEGARAVDLSRLKACRILNLDSEEEGVFLTGCAGGARIDCTLPLTRTRAEGTALRIVLKGLAGGHSGMEIQKERGNANCLLGRILYKLAGKFDLGILALKGGSADNVIAGNAEATIAVDAKDEKALREAVEQECIGIADELASKDPGFFAECVPVPEGKENGRENAVFGSEAAKAAAFLAALPDGVQAMSADVPGLVETSLNFGTAELKEDGLHVRLLVRSSVESAKQAVIGKVKAVTKLAGGKVCVEGDYPGWKYRADSPLRDKMIRLYRQMYGVEPRVEAIHAGLECGILGSKIKDPDCVSFGPDIRNIHTAREALSISSTARVWEYLVRLLEEKD